MKEDVVVGRDDFSRKLAEKLGARFVNLEVHKFPDNEIKPTLEIKSENDIKNKNTLVVSRTDRFNPNPDSAIIELGLTVRNLNHLEAEKVDILKPYMSYGRQDDSFGLGEPSSFWDLARLYERWFKDFGEFEGNLITINSHRYGKKNGISSFFRSMKVHDLSPSETFGKYFRNKKLKNPIVVVPGPVKMAQELAQSIGSEYEAFNKSRNHKTDRITFEHPKSNFRDKTVIIYDDVTATGGTVADTIDIVSETDPRKVYIALTHLISEKGIEKVCGLGADEVVTTDSFDSGKAYRKFTQLSTVPLFSEYIRRL